MDGHVPGAGKFGFVAETVEGAGIGSVFFPLSGAKSRSGWDNAAPWSLYGEQDGQILGGNLPAGSYTLTTTARSEDQGEILYVTQASFTVVADASSQAAAGPMTGFTPRGQGHPLRTGTRPERCSTEPVMWNGFMVP